MYAWLLKVLLPSMRENWPLVLGTFLYVLEAIICYRASKTGGMIMFIGYVIGNIGILIALTFEGTRS